MVSTYWNHKRLLIDYNQLFSCKTRIININFKLERMKDYAFVEAWKTHCSRTSMILGLSLLCAPLSFLFMQEMEPLMLWCKLSHKRKL